MRTFVVIAVGIVACGVTVAAQGGNTAKGEELFVQRKCGLCHKTTPADAKGGKLAGVLSDAAGKLSAEDIKAWLTEPAKMEAKLPTKPKMLMSASLKGKPAFTPAELNDLAAYVKSLAAKEDGARATQSACISTLPPDGR